MKPGYDQFFKNAKKANSGQSAKREHPNRQVRSQSQSSSQTKGASAHSKMTGAEEVLREALRVRSERRQRVAPRLPILSVAIIMLGLAAGGYGLTHPNEAGQWFNQIEIKLMSIAEAADPAPGSGEKNAETKANNAEQVADASNKSSEKKCVEMKGFSEEEMSHFNKLNERKDELDLREAELNALEEELHKQKSEIESRVAKLEQIREEVAGVLKERVEVDQQRVNTLVDFYSNMKPKQAADIFGKLNEDLAVEVLGKMKKKNAADILNLLEPTKARTLSEKFTGYKRL